MRVLLIAGCCSLFLSLDACAISERTFLQKNAGLDVCRSAIVTRLPDSHETNDAEHYKIELQPHCSASFLSSAHLSSQGECRTMLPKQGKCFYQFNHHSVVLSEGGLRDAYEVIMWH